MPYTAIPCSIYPLQLSSAEAGGRVRHFLIGSNRAQAGITPLNAIKEVMKSAT